MPLPFQGFAWRFVVQNIPTPETIPDAPGGTVTTWADNQWSARSIAFQLNSPTVITASVWPDNRNVNGIFDDDSDPLIAQSNRLIYAFRRDNPGGSPPWTIRAAGIIMSPEDQADQDVPLSHITAYDPWMYLGGRPVVDIDGNPPGPNGFSFFGHGNIVACQFLRDTISDPNGGFCFIDAGDGSRIGEGPQYANWGGTEWFEGTLEETPSTSFSTQLGSSVKDVWDQLCSSGNMDIVLKPIYDPVNRPGFTHELNIFNLAGMDNYSAVFSWDQFNRSASSIDRMHDGTPGSFINSVQYYSQQNIPIPLTGPLINEFARRKYLLYASMETFPQQTYIDPTGTQILQAAQQALTLQRQGVRTVTINPTPERSPVPFLDYALGDRVQVWITKRLRVASTGIQRVQSLQIDIEDDGIETVSSLVVSPDWRGVGTDGP